MEHHERERQMAIDYQRLYHTGIRVPDLDSAMAELGPTLNVTWAEVRDLPEIQLWSPGNGVQAVSLRFTYSCEGPQHVELLEGSPGCIWDGRDDPGLHHLGVWVDDVHAETVAALADGWTCAAASAPPEDGYGPWAYLRPPSGVIVEVVSEAIKAHFEPWWAEGLARAAQG
ncbi:MAG: VOC family protein [Acidimicrobiales bacterium]